MSRVILLEQLREFTRAVTGELFFPVAQQKEDALPPPPRETEVFCPRLPDSKAARKKAPYILHQVLTGKDSQAPGQQVSSKTTVRTIFCVYDPNEQTGGMALLTLMEQLRIAFLERPIVGGQFRLDLEAGIESFVYPEDSAPYYAGEMTTIWNMPPIKRLDATRIVHGMPPWDPNPRHLQETVKLAGKERPRPIPPEETIEKPKGSDSDGKENG